MALRRVLGVAAAPSWGRRVSFAWRGGRARAAAPAPVSGTAQEHREAIVAAAAAGRVDGAARERLGLLVAEGEPYGPAVCTAMLALGRTTADAAKVAFWWDAAQAEGQPLDGDTARAALTAHAQLGQADRACAALGVAVGGGLDSLDSTSVDWAHVLREWAPEEVCAAGTSLVKSGHVSPALRLQDAALAAVQGAHGRAQTAALDTLRAMSVLWLPAGRADACAAAYRGLAAAGGIMPLSLLTQLLQGAAAAGEWQLCVDIVDARHELHLSDAALHALDRTLAPLAVAAADGAGAATALALLSGAATWTGHSMPGTAEALVRAHLRREEWPAALAAGQFLAARPRAGGGDAPAATLNTLAAELLLRRQPDGAARLLFAAGQAWGGSWAPPEDLLEGWAHAALPAPHSAPTEREEDAAAAALQLPTLAAPVPTVSGSVRAGSGAVAPAAALLHFRLASGRAPSGGALGAALAAAHGASAWRHVLALSLAGLTADSFAAAGGRRESPLSLSPEPLAAAAAALAATGQAAPLAQALRTAVDLAFLRLPGGAAGSAAATAAASGQWNTVALLAAATTAAVRDGSRDALLRRVACTGTLVLPFLAARLASRLKSGAVPPLLPLGEAAQTQALLAPPDPSAASGEQVALAALAGFLHRAGGAAPPSTGAAAQLAQGLGEALLPPVSGLWGLSLRPTPAGQATVAALGSPLLPTAVTPLLAPGAVLEVAPPKKPRKRGKARARPPPAHSINATL